MPTATHSSSQAIQEHLLPRRKGAKHGDTLPVRFTPRFWEDADTRFAVIREIQVRVKRLERDANCDSYQKQILCQRCIFIASLLETAERDAIEGLRPLDVGGHIQATNCLIGLLKTLGLERKAKSLGLAKYVEQHGEQQDESEEQQEDVA